MCVCVYPLVLSANVRPLECVLVCVPLLEPLHAFKTLLKILQGCRYTQWTVWSEGSVRLCARVCVGVGWEAYSICIMKGHLLVFKEALQSWRQAARTSNLVIKEAFT